MRYKIYSTTLLLAFAVILLSICTGWMRKPTLVSNASLQKAINLCLPLLEKSGNTFIAKSKQKCASCHHNTLTSMATELAKAKGIPTVDSFAAIRVKAMVRDIALAFNDNLVTDVVPAKFAGPYLLLGLYAEKYPANIYTDIVVDYLINQAMPDGAFRGEYFRVPLESGDIHLTALTIRSIQLYASPTKKDIVKKLSSATGHWLENARPNTQQDMVFQLLGLHWCGSDQDKLVKAGDRLISLQHADGGWSQLPTLSSDAYATGQALYALYESGITKPEDDSYQKGLNYLLKTQDESGAWIVQTRSYPIQPFFNSDFPPYDENQFISAAASNWSVMALLNALPDKIK